MQEAASDRARLGRRVVLLAAPYQLPYLRSLAVPLEPVNQVSVADGARARSAQLRERIAARLQRADVDAELQQLAPLFEQYEPAEVAAALLALQRDGQRLTGGLTASQQTPSPKPMKRNHV